MPHEYAELIIGAWRSPEEDGIAVSHYFYPDGVYISQNPRGREFVQRGQWSIKGDQLTFSNLLQLHTDQPLDAKLYVIPILSLSPEAMILQGDGKNTAWKLSRAGNLPNRDENLYWRESSL